MKRLIIITWARCAGLPSAYIAEDEINYDIGAKIPLWLFGFLY